MIKTIFRFEDAKTSKYVDFEVLMPFRFSNGDNFDFENFPFNALSVDGFTGNYCFVELVRFEYDKKGDFVQIVFVVEH